MTASADSPPPAFSAAPLLRAADILLVLVLVALSTFGSTVLLLVVACTVLPLLWPPLCRDGLRALGAQPLAAFMVLQYPIVFWAISTLRPLPEGLVAPNSVDPAKWGFVGLGIALLLLRFGAMAAPRAAIRLALPIGILACVAALSVVKFAPDLLNRPPGCRIEGIGAMNPTPFIPGILIAGYALAALAAWSSAGRRGRAGIVALLALSVMVVWSYSGSRMIGLAQALCLGLAALALLRRAGWRDALAVASSVPFGLAMALAVDVLTGCELVARFVMAAEIAAGQQEVGNDGSFYLRFEFWRMALDWIAQAPLLGGGPWSEEIRMRPHGVVHVHNQYLSWTLWGGLIGLLSGLALFAAPQVAARGIADPAERVLWRVAALLLPLSLLTDTAITLIAFLTLHLTVTAMILRLAASDRAKARQAVEIPAPPSSD